MSQSHGASSHDTNMKVFAKIRAFLKDLHTCFGTENTDIVKYYELCKRTSIDDHAKIKKQVDVFAAYLLENETQIKTDQIDNMSASDISYTPKVKINLKQLISQSDKDVKKSILTYCKLLLCMIKPDEELKTNLVKNKSTKAESLFKDIFQKMEQTTQSGELQLSSNPMDLMSNIQNGSLQSFATDIQSKLAECDEKEIMDYTSGLLKNIKETSGDDPNLAGMFGLVDMLMSNLQSTEAASASGGGSASTSYQPPDPMQMIQTLSGGMNMSGSGADANPFMSSLMTNLIGNLQQKK
jgi:hypothetical protein